jgi:hypothetical protein
MQGALVAEGLSTRLAMDATAKTIERQDGGSSGRSLSLTPQDHFGRQIIFTTCFLASRRLDGSSRAAPPS